MTLHRAVVFAAAAAALGWNLMLAAPPLLHAVGEHEAGTLARLVFAPICHQDPARSLAPLGSPLAVCARCSGAYLGFLAGAMILIFRSVRRRATGFAPRSLLLASIVPTAAQWVLAASGLMPDIAAARASTAAIIGVAISFVIIPALESLARDIAAARGSISKGNLDAAETS